ncbi:hypothetical protein KKC94_05120 [Patescibacteria group bacterium]|nr:hypothetical protein [Patescibacteria group bacterium]
MKKKYRKWEPHLLIADELLSVIIILAITLLRPDYLFIGVYVLIIPYLILSRRTRLLPNLVISSIIAIIWTYLASSMYDYNHVYITILGMNAYPLFGWAIGLFGVYMIFSHYGYRFKKCRFTKKLLLFCLMYWILLIIAETVAYHIFNIHDLATAAYSGLPLCNCMHAPHWMQAAYFAMGPIYFLIIELKSRYDSSRI